MEMVRINLINPGKLADQHLIAEYNEILMLFGYVKKYPKNEGIPEEFTLGKGHIKFFKNKLIYLKSRHERIKNEMRKRGFKTNKKIDLSSFSQTLINDWKPNKRDFSIIKSRLANKIMNKEDYYRYYGVKKEGRYFLKLLE